MSTSAREGAPAAILMSKMAPPLSFSRKPERARESSTLNESLRLSLIEKLPNIGGIKRSVS